MPQSLKNRGRAERRETESHRYKLGETVQLKRRLGMPLNTAEVYRITATLPSRDNVLQYRIRNDDERHERVAAEDNLEPVRASAGDQNSTLIERTFSNGKGTETQQSRDPKAEAGEGSAKG